VSCGQTNIAKLIDGYLQLFVGDAPGMKFEALLSVTIMNVRPCGPLRFRAVSVTHFVTGGGPSGDNKCHHVLIYAGPSLDDRAPAPAPGMTRPHIRAMSLLDRHRLIRAPLGREVGLSHLSPATQSGNLLNSHAQPRFCFQHQVRGFILL
jgi:hypothetical protein